MAAYARLRSRLPELTLELDRAVGEAVKIGAEAIAAEARARVPVSPNPPHLRDAIEVRFRGDNDYAVVAGSTEAFYGHLVEFGTVHSAPRPFLVPAFEANRAGVKRAVRTAIAQAVARTAIRKIGL